MMMMMVAVNEWRYLGNVVTIVNDRLAAFVQWVDTSWHTHRQAATQITHRCRHTHTHTPHSPPTHAHSHSHRGTPQHSTSTVMPHVLTSSLRQGVTLRVSLSLSLSVPWITIITSGWTYLVLCVVTIEHGSPHTLETFITRSAPPPHTHSGTAIIPPITRGHVSTSCYHVTPASPSHTHALRCLFSHGHCRHIFSLRTPCSTMLLPQG